MGKRGRGKRIRRNKRVNRAQQHHSTTPLLSSMKQLTGTPLPDELVLEILYRTPVKALITFRCVSKSWLALTFDRNFISMHLFRNVSTRKGTLVHGFAPNHAAKIMVFLRGNETPVNLFELRPRQIVPPRVDYPERFSFLHFFNEMMFCGSINGIVCLSHCQHPDLGCFVEWGLFCVLWNPSLNRAKVVMLPERRSELDIPKYVSVGLGFDADANDYKIIRIGPNRLVQSLEGELMSRVEIYSANLDSWKEMNDGDLIPFTPSFPSCQFIVKGVPYWVWAGGKDAFGVIDPCTEMLREVPYPKYVRNERTEVHTVNLMDSVAVLIYSPGVDVNHLIDVHVLDESCGCWVKKYTTQPIVTDGLRLPQCLTTGELVVELWEGDDSDNRDTFFYDPNTKRLSSKFDAFVPVWDQSYTHVESLVCLEGMEPIEIEDKEMTWNEIMSVLLSMFRSNDFEVVISEV